MTKKLNKKGFTLTELIVVIVIIGILAAVLIPSLTGYIDRAKQSAVEQEAGEVYRLAVAFNAEDIINLPDAQDTFAEYLSVYGGITLPGTPTITGGDNAAVTVISYVTGSNYTVTITMANADPIVVTKN